MAYQEPSCTFTFEGQGYTAGGAYITETWALVYVDGNPGRDVTGNVTDWHGNVLGVWHVCSRWTERRGAYPMASLRVTLGPTSPLPGSAWYGRLGSGWGSLVRLRRVRRS